MIDNERQWANQEDSKDLQSDTTSPAATAKRRLTERIIPKAYRENFPPHTHGDEFKETPGNPLGEGEKSLWKKITRYDNRSFLHQGRSLTAASEKITQGLRGWTNRRK